MRHILYLHAVRVTASFLFFVSHVVGTTLHLHRFIRRDICDWKICKKHTGKKKKSASRRRVLLTCTMLAKEQGDGVLSVAWGSCELGYHAAVVTSHSSSVGSPTHPPDTHSLYKQRPGNGGNVLHVYLKTATHTMTGCLRCEIRSCLTDGCAHAHMFYGRSTSTHAHTRRRHSFSLIAIIISHYVQKITMACESNRGDRWRPLWASPSNRRCKFLVRILDFAVEKCALPSAWSARNTASRLKHSWVHLHKRRSGYAPNGVVWLRFAFDAVVPRASYFRKTANLSWKLFRSVAFNRYTHSMGLLPLFFFFFPA